MFSNKSPVSSDGSPVEKEKTPDEMLPKPPETTLASELTPEENKNDQAKGI